MRSIQKLCARLFAVAFVLTLTSAPAFGQASSTGGALSGVVADQQGGVLPGVTVTARNADTGLERASKTDANGGFRFPALPSGNYEIRVNATGFAPLKRTGIVLRVGDEANLKLVLNVTGATETVNITAAAPVTEPARTQISSTIDEQAIRELPINGRRWSNFVTLTPGVTPDGSFGLISFRGISGLLNNNTIDGADNNQAFFSEERGRTRLNYVVSQESIKEFQVNTQNYSPEFGRAAGGVVNAVTKSGTNQLRGSGFYYLRDDALNARNPLDFTTVRNANGSLSRVPVKPADRRQQFGGTLGGPIKKDRLFWFFSYDQQKRNFPANAQPSTATFFQECYTQGIAAAACDQAVAFILPQTGVMPRRGDQWIFLPKIDWQITANQLFSASYNYTKWDSPNGIQSQPVITNAASNNGTDRVRADIVNLRLTSTLSPSLLNEARFQYGRDFESQLPNAPNTVGLNIGSATAGNSGTGFNLGMAEFLPRNKFPDERKLQWVDSLTVARGEHTFKFGGDVSRALDVIDNLRFGGGYYNYAVRNNRSALANFALDLATPGQRNYANYRQAFGPAAVSFHTWDLNFFAQDEWKLRPNLTLNYGVRYETIKMPQPLLPNPAVPETQRIPEDHNNLGPRIGAAWDLFNDHKTVLRIGYGVYYGRIINSAIFNALTVTGAPGSVVNIDFNATNGPVYPNRFASQPTGGTIPRPDIFFFADELRAPLIHQGDIVIERELRQNLSVSASYLTSRGRDLPLFFDRNLPPSDRAQDFLILDANNSVLRTAQLPIFRATRPNAAFARMMEQQSAVRSSYDAFVAQVNQRFARGLQFQAHYTIASARDNGQTSTTFTSNFPTALNQFALQDEWGRSRFHVRHRFIGNFVWELPLFRRHANAAVKTLLGGWKLNGIVTLQSGATVEQRVNGNLPTFRGPDGVLIAPTSSGPNGSGGSLRVPFEPRNAFNQRPLQNIDLRLAKEFRIGERFRLDFIAEAFNLFNRTNVFGVNQNEYNLGTASPTGGACASATTGPCLPAFRPNNTFLETSSAQSTLYRERQMQVAVRLNF